MDLSRRLCIASIAEDAGEAAREYGLGLEISDYCTACNMDTFFNETDQALREKLGPFPPLTFHAPFNELCPAAIDPLIVEVAARRYRQALEVMRGYGVKRLVAHSGYLAEVYDEGFFIGRSVDFWREIVRALAPDEEIMLENTFEEAPGLLLDIVSAVGDARFNLCLDVGHANLRARRALMEDWLSAFSPRLTHLHLHNNPGDRDWHGDVFSGTADMARIIETAISRCPRATFALETLRAGPSLHWLREKGYLGG